MAFEQGSGTLIIPAERVTVIADISRERDRQIDLGWTHDHDNDHTIFQFTQLAHTYLDRAVSSAMPRGKVTRDMLVKSAAILVAAIEAHDRKGK